MGGDAVPGEPDDDVADGRQGGVAFAVGVEGAARAVIALAVELDDDALTGKDDVDGDEAVAEVDDVLGQEAR